MLRQALKPLAPRWSIALWRSWYWTIYRLRHHLTARDAPHLDLDSKVASVLTDNWSDCFAGSHPRDRRMRCLADQGVDGMSTENIRFLINEVVKRFAEGGLYMEVGTYRGCSLLSAALYNARTQCVGVDNFSLFDPEQENEKYLKSHLAKFDNPKNIQLRKGDYSDVVPEYFKHRSDLKVNVYFYDGPHSFEDQLKGLEIVRPHLARESIVLVDDLNVPEVERANRIFLRQNPNFRSVFRVKTNGENPLTWWNGFEVIATI